MKQLLSTIMALLLTVTVMVAQKNITGTVFDENGEPVIGANVVVKNSDPLVGTTTDFNGTYSLKVPAGLDVLMITYIGYTDQEVTIGASNRVDVTLAVGVQLSEAVVTALGISRSDKAIGYAAQTVDGDDLLKTNSRSFIDALSGQSAGVYVNSSSGAAGASSRILIRGQSSFNGENNALIVVDGLRISNNENHSERSLGGVAVSNRGIDISPDDIESITVLKGAAATALYGVDGANGVVQIITKKGKGSKGLGIEFRSGVTISQVNRFQPTQSKYVLGTGGGIANGGIRSWGALADTLYWDGVPTEYDPNGTLIGATAAEGIPTARKFEPYNPSKDFFRTGSTWNNALSITGGGKEATYRFSFANTKENGIIPNNTFQRTNVGLASTADLFNNKLHAATSINYVNSGGQRIQQGSNTSGLTLSMYRTPISFDNGAGLNDPANDRNSYYYSNGTQRRYGAFDNPYWIVNNAPFNDETNRMFGNVSLDYDILPKWLTAGTVIGTDFYSDKRTQSFEIGSAANPGGFLIDDSYFYRNIDAYFRLRGGDYIGENFSLNYNVGINMFSEDQKNVNVTGSGFTIPEFPTLSNSANINSTVTLTQQKNFSVYGVIEAGFKNMLYLTLTGRQDWLSTLATREYKVGDIGVFYPSASLSFVFSELLPENNILSNGKLRLAYAQVGGGAPSAYLTSTTYVVPQYNGGTVNDLNDGWTNGIGFPYNGSPGFVLNAVAGASTIKPARTTDFEVGTQLDFFNRRLGVDFTYYTRKSADQIIPIQVATSSGFQRAVFNSGALQTNGVELVLSATPILTKSFSWDMKFNFSSWKTWVDELPVANQYLDGFTGTGVYNIAPEEDGTRYQFGQLLGGDWLRANNADGTAYDATLPYNPNGAVIIQDDPTKGGYGYPVADPINRVIGNPNPDFLLGIGNTFAYKGFTLDFLFDIKQGGDMWNGTNGAMTNYGTSLDSEVRDAPGASGNFVFEGIKSDGTENNIVVPLSQAWYQTNGGGFGTVARQFVEDASWYRLRVLSLSYQLNKKWLQNTPLGDVTVSFTGRNLLLFTPYSGIDPETSLVGSSSNGQGLDYFQLPNTKSYAFGLSVKF